MKYAVWVPLFDELADPVQVARLAAAAEESGWDGFFVWDQLWWRAPVREVADPWITMSAIAAATERLRIGPMVTPVARRRPTKLLRETTTLDQLSAGRLILGIGLGSDRFAQEYSKTGEELNDRIRAEQMDETLDILTAGWTGEPVQHHGKHHVVDDVRFLPRPVAGRVPIWAAAFPGSAKPVRRAARYDGFFPVHLTSAEQLADAAEVIRSLRGSLDGYDVAIAPEQGTDPRPYAAAGATWWLTDTDPETLRLADARAIITAGPPQ
ncbi:LLM class flavin-dependent oxidoreductase [Kribbella hippodromi]|uniref:LLM class flavin-dependent oxidoreductase n=1 Tax=Kribbella hippodromi TaxID=434347 RepID=A0ABP4NRG7_9ACTN